MLQAGIPEKQLILAYEPEAAALYCKEVKLLKGCSTRGETHLDSFRAGTKFVIVDCGGMKVHLHIPYLPFILNNPGLQYCLYNVGYLIHVFRTSCID